MRRPPPWTLDPAQVPNIPERLLSAATLPKTSRRACNPLLRGLPAPRGADYRTPDGNSVAGPLRTPVCALYGLEDRRRRSETPACLPLAPARDPRLLLAQALAQFVRIILLLVRATPHLRNQLHS